LILPNGKGGTAQLDHVVLSQFGIFVVETKNRNGLIAGFPGDWLWRQTSGGKTYYFQNPMQQNDEHIRALAHWLDLRRSAFYSIVFFCGDARFDNPMPVNVRTAGVTTMVKSKNEVILTREEVLAAWNTLQACKRNGNLSSARHQQYVTALLSNHTRL
jgi:restriction system protein